MKKIELGAKVKDSITGFAGIVTARIEYITGCIQYEVLPQELKDGIPLKSQWLDEMRIVVIGNLEREIAEPETPPGGPQNHPPERHLPHFS